MDKLIDMETTCKTVNIDSLRDEYESNREWRLRRKFLELNSDTVSLDRLICLSRCFVNINMYGCSYSEAVMKDVHERSEGILIEVKSEKMVEAKRKYAMSFVKSSSSLETSPVIKSDAVIGNSKILQDAILSSSQNKSKDSDKPGSIQFNSLSPGGSSVLELGGYWVSLGDTPENVPDETCVEEASKQDNKQCHSLNLKTSAENSRTDIKVPVTASVLPTVDTQNLKTAAINSRTETQNSKITAINSRIETQNSKTTAINSRIETQNSKTTAINSRIETQNSKTTAINSRTETQNSKTTAINSRNETQNSKTTAINSRTETQNSKTTLTKAECLAASKQESNPVLQKIRKLAYESQNLKSPCQNAKETLHAASQRVPVVIDFRIENIPGRASISFVCHVIIEGIEVASEKGTNIKQAKTNACETAHRIILMPKIEIVESSTNVKSLKGSVLTQVPNPGHFTPVQNKNQFPGSTEGLTHTSKLPIDSVATYKESNMNSGLKRKPNQRKLLEEFIIVEHIDPLSGGGGAANILRKSADFSHMLLEFEYFPQGEATRCVVKLEEEVLADMVGGTRQLAKTAASAQCLETLRKLCWVLKMKQAVDSDTAISKEEVLKEIRLKSDEIGRDNVGNKLLQKMGWSGGGIGKDGTGISEPVSLMAVMNREGLGLGTVTGITNDFRKRIREVVQSYAASESQDDLVFSCDFGIEERKIVHEECRKLHLRSISRGKGDGRYLCVSRKRSANQLLQHVMSCGGETLKYKLLPPGTPCAADGS